MPYRHGHYYVAVVLLVILAGFWASYFAPIGAVPLAFHVHAMSASAWLLLIIAQSVAIHRRMNGLHRTMGLASFVLFPLLIVGFAMIINTAAERFAAREDAMIAAWGPSFGIGMAIAIAAYLTLFYLALKNRRNVRLHAGYMLATPLILFESPFSRLIGNYLPWLNAIFSEQPRGLMENIALCDTLATGFALVLYFRNRSGGTPWLVASAFMMAQAVAMYAALDLPFVADLFAAYARVPHWISLALAVLAGAAAGWFGWHAAPGCAQTREPLRKAEAT